MITAKMANHHAFARWFGQYNSTPRYPDIDWRPEEPIEIETLRLSLASGVPLSRNPASRFSFIRQGGGTLLLFVDGQCFECAEDTAALAESLCAQNRIILEPDLTNSDAAMALIA
jgi:50S ribosomal protein L16 3-hydroxylase